MQTSDLLTIILSILFPMFGGFIWVLNRMDNRFEKIDKELNEIKNRLTIIETVLQMFGAPIKLPNKRIDE